MSDYKIDFKKVCKDYGGKTKTVRALQDINLSIEKGEFCALRGPSGCGKTTALLIAGGLLNPDRGEVIVGGTNLSSLSPAKHARFRAEKIGFVFQQFHLIPYLDIIDNVRAPSIALNSRNGFNRAADLAKRFGLCDRLKHIPSELSTGERQRVALARAMFNEPEVILADEPTGNLDEKNAQTVLEGLRQFARAGGTVLLVTHDDRAAHVADRVIEMEQGKLV